MGERRDSGPSVDTLLAAAVRGRAEAGSVGETRAVAAFRAAREQGTGTARTRRRDDWRPNALRGVQLSIRTTADETQDEPSGTATSGASNEADGPKGPNVPNGLSRAGRAGTAREKK